MEDMAVGTADQETALEDTASRLEAKENLLQAYPWFLGIPLPKKEHTRKEMSLPKEDSGHTPQKKIFMFQQVEERKVYLI